MPDPFDFKYSLLPPEIKAKLWVLSLDADTSKVNLAYHNSDFTSAVGYKYGGSATASLTLRRVTGSAGYNPGTSNVDLGLVYRGFKFGAAFNPARGSGGGSFSYGAPLLPYPWELEQTFTSGAHALEKVVGDVGAASKNPLDWYKLHSDDVHLIGEAVKLGQKINDSAKSESKLGVGLRINYAQDTGLTIYSGIRIVF